MRGNQYSISEFSGAFPFYNHRTTLLYLLTSFPPNDIAGRVGGTSSRQTDAHYSQSRRCLVADVFIWCMLRNHSGNLCFRRACYALRASMDANRGIQWIRSRTWAEGRYSLIQVVGDARISRGRPRGTFATMLWLRILSLVATASALNILLSNDDSWVSANIRETYKALRADGHDVLLVGSAVQQSGKGGSFVLPTVNITAPGGEFGSVPIGAPPFGSDPMDQNLWYFNGTPAATVAFGLDIVAPMHFGNKTLDLVVTGPNEGSNLGPFLYTLSGTLGAAYAAVYRGFPAVAFSGSNGTHRSFTEVTEHNDAATIQGKLVANFVAALSAGINTTTTRLLDLGVGVSVGFPVVGGDNPCVDPPFTATRITGGALMDKIRINATTGMPQFDDVAFDGLNVNFTGDPRLPGETNVTENCQTSVSVFAVDYDAPLNLAAPIQNRLIPIFGRTSLPEAA